MSLSKLRICHLTSVHPYTDTRIFHKECVSLVTAGYETHFVVPGAPNEVIKGVHVHGVPKSNGSRLNRMTQTVWLVYRKAQSLNTDIYHFHDPELIPIGLLLRAQGKQVIYDIHEDVPRDILTKHYLSAYIRPLISWNIELFENKAAGKFSALIAATPAIGQRFQSINPRTVVLNNYPLLNELYTDTPILWERRLPSIAYVGVITETRGISQMVEAMEYVPQELKATLELAGPFSLSELHKRLKKQRGWSHVHELGILSRTEVAQLLSRVCAGLVVIQATPAFLVSQATKLFEYMSAGIPVIASDFPLWREFIERTGCGLVVDPLNARSLGYAITFILTQPKAAENMGKRGREAIEKWYNWELESSKLVQLYNELFQESV